MANNRKLVLVLLLSGLTHFSLKAQSGFVASGASLNSSSGSVSYSVGQLDYLDVSGTGGSINMGLQQPFEFFEVTDVKELDNSELNGISVFPNPAHESVTLLCETFDQGSLHYALYDLQGRTLLTGNIQQRETPLQLEEFAFTIYFIRIWSSENKSKTVKIIKSL
ncbi:MAG: T9SS type A sorting domain-containing protein [Bacteroidia bacterium]|jgi:hypothetical protein